MLGDVKVKIVFRSAMACGLALLLLVSNAYAERLLTAADPAISTEPGQYLARIELHTAEEIEQVFSRAEILVNQANDPASLEPVAFVLHGPEIELFTRNNYGRYKNIVDKAAQLDAFNVIDIKVCEAWLEKNKLQRANLPAFIETVPYAPAEERRLLESGYNYF